MKLATQLYHFSAHRVTIAWMIAEPNAPHFTSQNMKLCLCLKGSTWRLDSPPSISGRSCPASSLLLLDRSELESKSLSKIAFCSAVLN